MTQFAGSRIDTHEHPRFLKTKSGTMLKSQQLGLIETTTGDVGRHVSKLVNVKANLTYTRSCVQREYTTKSSEIDANNNNDARPRRNLAQLLNIKLQLDTSVFDPLHFKTKSIRPENPETGRVRSN